MRLLVANRGEIARRIFRTAKRLGHHSIAVYADADASAPHVSDADAAVLIGPAADLSASYLSADRILDAAARTGATAVHPGYGFLSENGEFAQAVLDADLIWVGPHPAAIEAMGSKIEARRRAAASGATTIPGFDQSQDPAELKAAAERIGYPVLVKASAGGGGKGIRIALDPAAFDDALATASAEAENAFGDGRMIVERFITQPRHIEVQVIGDKHGQVISLGTRECSLQRRYQKVIEEAPAPNLSEATREALCNEAVAMAKAIDYDSAGTVEFIVDDTNGEHFFLEMNTRLQVEHPVTEFVTGVDLVELMLRSASGDALIMDQVDVVERGHAIEARINAEDPGSKFAPQLGTIGPLVVPAGVRWESAIEPGSEITPFFDSMIAKLIVGADSRPQALAALRVALDQLVVGGLAHNTGYLRWLLDQPPVIEGRVTTRFIDETPIPEPPAPPVVAAATAWSEQLEANSDSGPWSRLPGFSLTPRRSARIIGLRGLSGSVHEVSVPFDDGDTPTVRATAAVDFATQRVAVNDQGYVSTFDVVSRTERWRPEDADRGRQDGAIVAPFPAVISSIEVTPGDTVAAGDVLVTIEAMKMIHSLSAAGPATVAEVRVAPGDQVTSGQLLITFDQPD